jgi:chitin synthase
MFLAEDRILCLKIYCRDYKNYTLQYIPEAYSLVDPVTNLMDFMGQRKRWINGSWYALEYVLNE